VRCARCGNENPGTNRFCGMCGATLTPEPVPASSQSTPSKFLARSAPAAPSPERSAAAPSPEPPALPAASKAEESPYISGPSFLGLSEPPASQKKRGNLSMDTRATSSARNLDYLLEDDEEPRSGGVGKFVLIAVVVALALAVGLGYLRWKGPSGSKTADTPPGAGQDSASDSSSTTQPTAPTTAATRQEVQPAPPPSSSGPAPSTASSSEIAPAPDRKLPDSSAANATDAGNSKELPSIASDSSPKANSRTEPIRPAPEPRPARALTKSADPVAEAQKYIYGRGAQQDCDRGMRLLKPSAEQANPKAMIEMGALYSAGLCAPRDLPTSYRWFARALRKQPDNLSIQTDLQKLWGEMTQPERQLAIKLSQ
jgi:hypothetical protein